MTLVHKANVRHCTDSKIAILEENCRKMRCLSRGKDSDAGSVTAWKVNRPEIGKLKTHNCFTAPL